MKITPEESVSMNFDDLQQGLLDGTLEFDPKFVHHRRKLVWRRGIPHFENTAVVMDENNRVVLTVSGA